MAVEGCSPQIDTTAPKANFLKKHLFSGTGERDKLSLRREAGPQGDVIAHTTQSKVGREGGLRMS